MGLEREGDVTVRNIHLLAIVAGLVILVLVLYFAGVL
jgi:hypothetical protein